MYSVNFSMFDVGLLVVFGLLGYAMRKLDIPPAPLVLAFVLGPIAENSIRQSLLLSDNSPMIYLQRPISAVLIGMAVLLLLVLTFGRRDPQGPRAGGRRRRMTRNRSSYQPPTRKESDHDPNQATPHRRVGCSSLSSRSPPAAVGEVAAVANRAPSRW